ncbi:MAG: 2-oxoacid:acceptor oxidoreductase subunit alpha, partial [Acidobacteriia bacterium]|nr:2-oxoacid:acceptor oxidoreductase subunit alpha [Terriglobia bacterium]
FRHDPDGKATYAVVQAEDEIAAVGMALSAGWAGARSMTSTSGPGISLMSEFLGLGYYAELPAVIFDIQRVGPSTGLPTRTAQGDILSTAILSHGDTHHPIFFPGTVEECFSMSIDAFDFAERFQTPVFVLSDLDLGMNSWMTGPFPYPEKPLDRGKVLTAEQLDGLGGFARYKDVDGDGVGYRTLPGTRHPAAAYFTRGSGHNEKAQYTEREDDYRNNMDRLAHKFETMRQYVPAPVIEIRQAGQGLSAVNGHSTPSRVGLICVGSSGFAVREASDQLWKEHGIATVYFRLLAYPFTEELPAFVRQYDRVYVVEQNRDAQLLGLMRLELEPELIAKLRSVRYYGGLPLDARTVTDEVVRQEIG